MAYLFGSTVKGSRQPISDIDIAVLLKDNNLKNQVKLIFKLSKALKMSNEKIDLIDLKYASIHLKYRMVKEGIKIIDKGIREELLKELIELYPEVQENLRILFRG